MKSLILIFILMMIQNSTPFSLTNLGDAYDEDSDEEGCIDGCTHVVDVLGRHRAKKEGYMIDIGYMAYPGPLYEPLKFLDEPIAYKDTVTAEEKCKDSCSECGSLEGWRGVDPRILGASYAGAMSGPPWAILGPSSEQRGAESAR